MGSAPRWFRVLLPLLALAPARAQFSGLSATDDGAIVYFASSLRMRGTSQFLWSKIFRIDSAGASLVAQRDQLSPVPPTNPYWLDQPQVSGDGRLLMYHARLFCGAGSSCFLREQRSATLRDTATGEETYAGANARISRNGRFLASYNSTNVMGPRFTLADRATSATLFQGNFAPSTVSIASGGTTALTVSGSLQLISDGSLTTLRDADVAAAAISDTAAVIYETRSRRRLYVLDLNSGQTQQLGPDNRDSFQATLSADGQWVAYLSTIGSTPQVFFSRLNGSDWKQLTTSDDAVVEATLSGDGRTVFAVTAPGSMLRIDTLSGTIAALVGPTPVIQSVQSTTPGSLTPIHGSGLTNASVEVAGLDCPILRRSAADLWFQLPWEAPLTANTVTIPEGGDPYFDDSAPLGVAPFAPQAIPLAPAQPNTYPQPIAIHSDFSSLVTSDHPAAPGEVVHIYLTGGGAVTVPVATGAPGPLEPLSLVTTLVSLFAGGQPLQVYFFGLAPALVGVWQMDVALPSSWSEPTMLIEIRYQAPPPNAYGTTTYLPVIPIRPGG